MDVGTALLALDPHEVSSGRRRAWCTGPVIASFAVGCGLGATCEAVCGPWSLLLPAGFAFAVLALGFNASSIAVDHRAGQRPIPTRP